MVKKITKYLKFVVCCALIMSLVAPSYAALSASDGSAFVTKAEFDSALADFNARLTTFEAGINSKIDSQVTSYLDRNGIWNGQSQSWTGSNFSSYTTTFEGKSRTVHYIAGGVSSYFNTNPKWDEPLTTLNTIVMKTRTRISGLDAKIVINEINKSGLLYLILNTSTGSSANNARNRLIDESLGTSGETLWVRSAYADTSATSETVYNLQSAIMTYDYAASASLTVEINFGLNSVKDKSLSDYKMTYVLAKTSSEFYPTYYGSSYGTYLPLDPNGQKLQGLYALLPIGFSDIKNQTMNMFVTKGQQLVMNIDTFCTTNSDSASSAFQTRYKYPDDYSTVAARGKYSSAWVQATRASGYLGFGFEDIKVY